MPRGHVSPNAQVLSALRGEAGLTQEELAARAGYGLRTVSKIENGCRTTAATLRAVATVLSRQLARPVHLGELLRRSKSDPSSCDGFINTPIFAENIKLLELGAATNLAPPVNGAPLAVLTDTFVFRFLPPHLRVIDFPYASAAAAHKVESLSHADTSDWQPQFPAERDLASVDESRRRGVLRVDVARGPDNSPPLVQNRISYHESLFSSAEAAGFHAQVFYPTDWLTILIRFPHADFARTLRGLHRSGPNAAPEPTARQPIRLDDGHLAYWQIPAPAPGQHYQLAWC